MCSLLIFNYMVEFEFLEEGFRMEIMGWTEETGQADGFEEIIGYAILTVFIAVNLVVVCGSAGICYVRSS